MVRNRCKRGWGGFTAGRGAGRGFQRWKGGFQRWKGGGCSAGRGGGVPALEGGGSSAGRGFQRGFQQGFQRWKGDPAGVLAPIRGL